jgi:hypothetical protein
MDRHSDKIHPHLHLQTPNVQELRIKKGKLQMPQKKNTEIGIQTENLQSTYYQKVFCGKPTL